MQWLVGKTSKQFGGEIGEWMVGEWMVGGGWWGKMLEKNEGDREETKNNAKNMKKTEEEIYPNECVTSDLFGDYNREIT